MSSTTDPLAAQAHARAMAGTAAGAMPILPPRADDLPAGMPGDALLWEETIAPVATPHAASRHAAAAP